MVAVEPRPAVNDERNDGYRIACRFGIESGDDSTIQQGVIGDVDSDAVPPLQFRNDVTKRGVEEDERSLRPGQLRVRGLAAGDRYLLFVACDGNVASVQHRVFD